jgi:hypothetical protein
MRFSLRPCCRLPVYSSINVSPGYKSRGPALGRAMLHVALYDSVFVFSLRAAFALYASHAALPMVISKFSPNAAS